VTVHRLVEADGNRGIIRAACTDQVYLLSRISLAEVATAWEQDVTCPDCRALINVPHPAWAGS
jgi:hypothetical protein